MLQTVVPVEDQVLLRDLPAALHDELDGLQEVRLALWNLGWIDIGLLKSREKELTDACVIAVRAHHGNRHSQSLQHLHRAFGSMVACA